MRRPDDYLGEMATSSSDEAQVIERIRGSLLRAPTPDVAAAHLAAMTAAARDPALEELRERGNAMHPFTRKRALVLAAAATLALGAGLAAAVTLPDQASDRAEEVQAAKPVKSPEATVQDGPTAQSSEHGEAVSALAHDDANVGCEHGRAVSDLASSKAADNRQGDGPADDPCEKSNATDAGTAKVKGGPRGKALGHGEPPGKRVGQTAGAGSQGAATSAEKSGGRARGHGESTAGTTGASTTSGGSGAEATSTSPPPEPAPTPAGAPTA